LEHLIKHKHDVAQVKTFNMPCVSVNDLLRKLGIVQLDYLFVDCEGEDFNIVNAIDLSEFDIRNIKFEHTHLDGSFRCGDHYHELVGKLEKHGYKCCRANDGNTTACKLRPYDA
jgi:hypothetical protein